MAGAAEETKAVSVKETPEYKKLLKENEKLAQKVENQKKALKGKQTEIAKLRKQVEDGTGMRISKH